MIPLLGFLIFIYSVILHEVAHGFMAERLGDPTAKISGRLTLNPFPHIDLIWSVLFPFFLFFSGSRIIFGAAKPVPIDPYNFRNPRKDTGLVGLAGPATNLLLALIFSIISRIILPYSQTVVSILASTTYLNIVLAVLNLIPIPPLDGSRILAAILPEKQARSLGELERYGILIIALFLLFPTPFFSIQKFIATISTFIFNLIFPSFSLI